MTVGCVGDPNAVDFFSLHNRKKKTIHVDMLDYGFVENCSDLDELKGILAMLRSGKEGRYPDLEKATETRILAVLPESERMRIVRMQTGPTPNQVSSETDELMAWSSEIDRTHEALREHRSRSRRLPPVRGQTAEPVAVATTVSASLIEEVTPGERQNRPKQAIPAYDFRAWEKFNVDKALEELDNEEAEKREQAQRQRDAMERRAKERVKELASLPSYIDLDEISPEERAVFALHEKQKGNEAFKANENEDAVLYYTRSIAFDDTSAILYANRAMAHLRMKSFALAEQDCSRAIELDPHYVKAWNRRGMTRFRRGNYEGAVKDFEQSLLLAPGSNEVEKLLQKTLSKWKEVNGSVGDTTSQANAEASASARQLPVKLPVKQTTAATTIAPAKPFKRFEIIEDSDDEDDDDDEQGSDNQRPLSPVEKPFQRFEIIED